MQVEILRGWVKDLVHSEVVTQRPCFQQLFVSLQFTSDVCGWLYEPVVLINCWNRNQGMSCSAQEEEPLAEIENVAWYSSAEKLPGRKVSSPPIRDASLPSWFKLIPLLVKSSPNSWTTFGLVSKARIFYPLSLKRCNQQLTPWFIEILRRASVGRRLKEWLWWHSWDSVRRKVQGLLVIHPNIGDLKIGGENFGNVISSDFHSVQLV